MSGRLRVALALVGAWAALVALGSVVARPLPAHLKSDPALAAAVARTPGMGQVEREATRTLVGPVDGYLRGVALLRGGMVLASALVTPRGQVEDPSVYAPGGGFDFGQAVLRDPLVLLLGALLARAACWATMSRRVARVSSVGDARAAILEPTRPRRRGRLVAGVYSGIPNRRL